MKSGFVAVVGKPNVGKSSIVNALVGEKVSIIGPKPQTTRNKILGIKNGKDFQVVFVDTPGFNNQKSGLGTFMQSSIAEGMRGVDAVLVVMDGNKINDRDYEILNKVQKTSGVQDERDEGKKENTPVFVAVNKLDISTFERVYPELTKLSAIPGVRDIVNVSALKGDNLELLFEKILKVMPEGHPYFDTDSYTDKTERFMVAELVREKALLFLQEEIPHGIAVDVPSFVKKDEAKSGVEFVIDVEIICERAAHKKIIIGKNGVTLKKIVTSARRDIEKMLSGQVYLNCFVKVREGWRDDRNQLRNVGYDIKSIN